MPNVLPYETEVCSAPKIALAFVSLKSATMLKTETITDRGLHPQRHTSLIFTANLTRTRGKGIFDDVKTSFDVLGGHGQRKRSVT
jgi:hypothetical protein